MEDTAHRGEFELWWRQTGPESWVATVLDRETGSRWEVRSLDDLEAALLRLLPSRDGAAPCEGRVDEG